MLVEQFLEWLGATPWSVALLESLWVWPLLESSHVLTLGLFVGTAVMMDLKLIGVSFRTVPFSEFRTRMLPYTRLGFALMVITGLLIFYSSPARYYYNIFFRIKMIVLVLSGLNIWLFHSRILLSEGAWDRDARPPRAARIAGGISLVTWSMVVVAGRMIAYNWFDCSIQPQPDWVNWAAGCILPPQ